MVTEKGEEVKQRIAARLGRRFRGRSVRQCRHYAPVYLALQGFLQWT